MKKFITFLSFTALIFSLSGSVLAQGVGTPQVSATTNTSAAAKNCAKVTNQSDIKAAKGIRDTAIKSAQSIRNIALKSAKEIRNTALNSAQTLDKDAAKTAVRAAKDAYATSIRAAKDAYATAILAAKDAYAVSVNQPARYTRDAALESAKLTRGAALESARYIRNAALESAGARRWWNRNADQTAVTAAKDAYAIAVNAANDAYATSAKAAKDAYAIAMKDCELTNSVSASNSKVIPWCDARKSAENELWISSESFNGMNHAPTIRHVCRENEELFYLQMVWDDSAAVHTGIIKSKSSETSLSISSENIDPEFKLLQDQDKNTVRFTIDKKIFMYDEDNDKFIANP